MPRMRHHTPTHSESRASFVGWLSLRAAGQETNQGLPLSIPKSSGRYVAQHPSGKRTEDSNPFAKARAFVGRARSPNESPFTLGTASTRTDPERVMEK